MQQPVADGNYEAELKYYPDSLLPVQIDEREFIWSFLAPTLLSNHFLVFHLFPTLFIFATVVLLVDFVLSIAIPVVLCYVVVIIL